MYQESCIKNRKNRACFMLPDSCFERKGQSLVELMTAMTVFTVGFLSLLGLLSQSLGLNRVVSNNYIGTYLAAEGVELVKNLLDANIQGGTDAVFPWNARLCTPFTQGAYELQWDVRWGSSGELLPVGRSRRCGQFECQDPRVLRYDARDGGYGYIKPTLSIFRRTIYVDCELSNGNEIKVNSVVKWRDRGQDFTANAEDHFYNWRPIP